MNRKQVLKRINAHLSNCRGCTKPPKHRTKHADQYVWCRNNCPIAKQLVELGKELDVSLQQVRAECSIKQYRQENEMRPSAGTPDLGQITWNDLLNVF